MRNHPDHPAPTSPGVLPSPAAAAARPGRPSRLGLLAAILALSLLVLAAPAGAMAKEKAAKAPHVSGVYELPQNLVVGGDALEASTFASANQRLYVMTIEEQAAALRHGPPYKTSPIAELTVGGKIKLIKDSLHPTDARWEGIGVGADDKVWVSASVHGEKTHLGVITGSSIKLYPSEDWWAGLLSFGGVTYTVGSGLLTTHDNRGFGRLNIVPEPQAEFLNGPYVLNGGLVEFGPEYSYANLPAGISAPPGAEAEVKVPLQHVPGAPVGVQGSAAMPVQATTGIWYVDEFTGEVTSEQKVRPSVLRRWGASASYRIPGAAEVSDLVRGPDGKPWLLFNKSGRWNSLARVEADSKLSYVKAPKGWHFTGGHGSGIITGPGPYLWVAAARGFGENGLEHGAIVRVSG
ncbi:MAG TPA: hypothetical protein VHA76_03990 [Solirubrobacterales bacterium]|nr:hypothetical protein [Solirubrobacterales bacterium]